MAKLKFNVGAISDIGMKRANNEDNLFVPGMSIKDKYVNIYNLNKDAGNKPVVVENSDNTFFAVCDGMGGHNAGEEASYIAAQALQEEYQSIVQSNKYQEAVDFFNNLINEISNEISYASEENPQLRGMGTTIGGLYFFGDRVMPVNVGDSRVYVLKKNKTVQISQDHTDESSGKGVLTRYLGVSAELGAVTPYCGIEPMRISEKTRFLICSDGLTDMLDDEKIGEFLSSNKSPVDAAEALVETAKKVGGVDNITVQVIDAIPTQPYIVRAFRRPRTYITIGAAAVVILCGIFVFKSYIEPMITINKKYAGIAIEISEPDKALLNRLSPNVSESELNDTDNISEDENFEVQIQKLYKKLDAEYPLGEWDSGLQNISQRSVLQEAYDAYKTAKEAAKDELAAIEALRDDAYNISLRDEDSGNDPDKVTQIAEERSAMRAEKAEALQKTINEYIEKYFGGNTDIDLYIAKANYDNAKSEYDAEVKRLAEEAEKAKQESQSSSGSGKTKNSGGSNSSSSGSSTKSSGGSSSSSGSSTKSSSGSSTGGSSGSSSTGGGTNPVKELID